MKKRQKTQISALLMALILMLSVLGACAPSETNSAAETEPESSLTTPEESSQEASETSTASEDGTPSWEKDKSPVTLEWFLAFDWFGKKFDPETNLGDKQILEDTGVTLKLSSGDLEKFNALIASDSLPDIITCGVLDSQRTLLENNGQVLPLNELMEQYAPDLNVPESMMDWYRNEDGNWYALASFYYGPERANPEFGGSYATHNANFVRTDILEQIGMTMDDVKTKEGFMKALKAVKEKNITYDGKAVTPFQGANEVSFFEQFGGDPEDENGNWVNVRRTDEFLEALLFFNEMYLNGLITDEEFTLDGQQKEAKIASGAVFAVNAWSAVGNPRKSLYARDNNAQLRFAGLIEGGDNGKDPVVCGINSGGWTGTMISKNCKNPERAIQFFSYMTQEKSILDATWGVGAYEIVDGTVVKDPEVVKEITDNPQLMSAKYKHDLSYFNDFTIVQKYYPKPATLLEEDDYIMDVKYPYPIYDDKCFTGVTPPGGSELASIQEKIEAYWLQARPKIIMAKDKETCIAEYENAIKEMDALGMKELDEYKNERFQENKAKLGIERAFTR